MLLYLLIASSLNKFSMDVLQKSVMQKSYDAYPDPRICIDAQSYIHTFPGVKIKKVFIFAQRCRALCFSITNFKCFTKICDAKRSFGTYPDYVGVLMHSLYIHFFI